MLEELDLPTPKKNKKNLDSLSPDELDEYISALKQEIARVEEEKARKKSAAKSAAAFFGG